MADRLRFCLIIPSYWGRRSSEPANEEDAVYDHPTPLDAEGTISRALESVRLLAHDRFRVVVIGAATHPDLEEEVEARLAEKVSAFSPHFPAALFSHSHLREVQDKLRARGREDCAEMLSLYGYSNIRNLCLAVACLDGADAAVLFDDDQVYEDPFYLDKVAEDLGVEYRGHPVRGLAGYYVNRDGSFRLPPNRDWIFAEWPAVESMNLAFDIIAAGERLQPTPWVFGGNMVIRRELFMRVAFDPHVPRGEDIDYLINAKFLGHDFLLDNTLWIRHLPPPKSAPPWRRFREDLHRFIYTREKLRSQDPAAGGARMVRVEELDPYPGRFLRDDLEEMVFRTSVLMGMDCLSRGDGRGFSESMDNIRRARGEARPGFDPYRWYMDWRDRWEECMRVLDADEALREYMRGLYG